jgi:hypothetical protein
MAKSNIKLATAHEQLEIVSAPKIARLATRIE